MRVESNRDFYERLAGGMDGMGILSKRVDVV